MHNTLTLNIISTKKLKFYIMVDVSYRSWLTCVGAIETIPILHVMGYKPKPLMIYGIKNTSTKRKSTIIHKMRILRGLTKMPTSTGVVPSLLKTRKIHVIMEQILSFS